MAANKKIKLNLVKMKDVTFIHSNENKNNS